MKFKLYNNEPFTIEASINNVAKTVDLLDIPSNSDLSEVEKKNGQLNILCVGNSYTCDAIAYLPQVLQNIAPDLTLRVGILYKGGGSLQQHWENKESWPSNTGADHQYHEWNGGLGWRTIVGTSNQTNITLSQLLYGTNPITGEQMTANTWDIIMFQAASTQSYQYSPNQPYLEWSSSTSLPKWVRNNAGFKGKFAWLMTPSYPAGYQRYTSGNANYVGDDFNTPEKMYAGIVATTREIARLKDDKGDDIFTYIIPAGTAIQNARLTSLDSYGTFGHLSYDGLHQQEGAACLAETYTAAMTLSHSNTVLADDTLVTQDWLTAINAPQTHGTPVGTSAKEQLMTKWAACSAILTPYATTTAPSWTQPS